MHCKKFLKLQKARNKLSIQVQCNKLARMHDAYEDTTRYLFALTVPLNEHHAALRDTLY